MEKSGRRALPPTNVPSPSTSVSVVKTLSAPNAPEEFTGLVLRLDREGFVATSREAECFANGPSEGSHQIGFPLPQAL